MFEQGPTVTVYLNRRSGEFSVQPYARQFGVPQPFGVQTVLPRNVRDDELLQAILENLSRTDQQKYDFSQAPRPSSEERRRRLKEDSPIRVCQTRNGFELAPLKKCKIVLGALRSPQERFLRTSS
jgi:hypothetical protein